MDHRLEGKRAIVTGAASGIGKATAEAFAAEGAKVVLCDIDREDGQACAGALGGQVARFFYCDVADEASVREMVEKATGWLGGLEVLVNNAGVGGVGPPKPLAELSMETWDKTINTNLRGTYQVSKHCLPHLQAKGGTIVNVVSTYSIVGGPQLGAYCASKGGILALTRNMAIDYASDHVRVNALAPGFVDTPMLRADINKDPDPHGALRSVLAKIPQGELMTAEQVAKVILFLASDDSAIMTGSLVVADGGYTAW
jgi:NAD(P)-dependent dehydrogenase (short-subunit alcohol dehydrogenase family)